MSPGEFHDRLNISVTITNVELKNIFLNVPAQYLGLERYPQAYSTFFIQEPMPLGIFGSFPETIFLHMEPLNGDRLRYQVPVIAFWSTYREEITTSPE